MSVSYEYCVLSGRCLCDGLIPRPEKTYRVWCVSLSVIKCNNNPYTYNEWVEEGKFDIEDNKQNPMHHNRKLPTERSYLSRTSVFRA
jgi:hypothetical protein